MRFFTERAQQTERGWGRAVAAYARHLAAIEPRLSPDLARLATDPGLDLHAGRFEEVVVDLDAGVVTLVVHCGDVQIGYRRMVLRFEDARVVPDDLLRLAEAVGAEFRANHWHRTRAVTEVIAQELDVQGDAFVLRLRLWPFYEFGVEFARFSSTETATLDRRPSRAGRFSAKPADTDG